MHYPFWKDSINFSIFVLFNLFVSLTHSSKFKFEFFRLPIRLSSFICIALWLTCVIVIRALPQHFVLLVGLDGLEPSTSRLSGARSSHLSYRPVFSHLAYSVQSINCCWFCFPIKFLGTQRRESEPIIRLRRIVGLLATINFSNFVPRCKASSFEIGGDEGTRTLDPLLAGQVLSQLSYTPIFMGCSSL